jgi:hypothetical protein
METLIEERDHAPDDLGDLGDMTPTGPTPVQVWIAEDPLRACPHLDFGCRWIDPARPRRRHRVSWVPDTGELYVTDTAASYVRVLGVIPDRARLSTILAGWGVVGARPKPPLSWVEDRIASIGGSRSAGREQHWPCCPPGCRR